METITLSKEVLKNIAKNTYYSDEQFISDAQKWVNAIKEGRMLCNIVSVSSLETSADFVIVSISVASSVSIKSSEQFLPFIVSGSLSSENISNDFSLIQTKALRGIPPCFT